MIRYPLARDRAFGRYYAKRGAAACIQHVSHLPPMLLLPLTALADLLRGRKALDARCSLTPAQALGRYLDKREALEKADPNFRKALNLRIKYGIDWLDREAERLQGRERERAAQVKRAEQDQAEAQERMREVARVPRPILSLRRTGT